MRAGGWAQRTWVLALTGALVLTACTGDDGATDGTATTELSVPDEPVDGGTVTLGLGGPIVADPLAANPGSPSDLMVLDLLYDGLTRVDADGKVVGALATEWHHDGKATAWAFRLDPEATFSGGRRITAADVVASFERVLKRGDSSLAALRLERVKGFRAFVDGKAPHVSGLSARADGSFLMQLDAPVSVIPEIVAAPEMGIVDTAPDKAADRKDGGLGALELSGAWAVAEGDDQHLVLDRRAGSSGHLDHLALEAFEDLDAAYDAFDDGEVDWALVPASRFDEATEAYGDDHFAPFHAELFFGLRVRTPSLAKLELRQAIAAAVDREAIVEAVYPDRALPLDTVIPEGVPLHSASRCPRCGHDPARAQRLLKKAYPDGKVPTIQLDHDESPAQDAMADLIEADLAAVGIPVKQRARSLAEYKRFVVSGKQELFSFGWIGGYVSPDAYLAPLFASAADDNLTGYRHGGVDKALATARGPAAGRDGQWERAEARVLSDAIVVPIAQFRTQPVVAARVQGLAHAVDGTVDWAAVWVADAG